MTSPRHQEMDKLQVIEHQRAAVQQKLDERLPRQRSHLAALVGATKWRLATICHCSPAMYTQGLVDTTVKKLRMEVGAFEYAVKEQSEVLTRALFQLDDILSHGDAAIKDARKALVLAIQQLLERADQMNAQAASLKTFMERSIARLPAVPEDTSDEPMDDVSDETHVETVPRIETPAVNEQDDDWEHVDADDVQPLLASVNEDEKTQTAVAAESTAMEEDPIMVQPDETAADEDKTEQQDEESDEEVSDVEDEDAQHKDAAAAEQEDESPKNDTDSLPVWRPYYQIQKQVDGLYLLANLRGVDPRDVVVQATPQQGVLRISGVKYPTQKDLLLSQLSGAPTFGRFEIVERFPPEMLNLENASQQFRYDGTLQVRLPFYLVRHPRVMRSVSPFQPHGLVVW